MVKKAAGDCPELNQPGLDVLAEYEDRVIHPKRDIKMPCVVRLRAPIKLDYKRVKFSRLNVYMRDRGQCQYCARKVTFSAFEFEHVVPRSQGGRTGWSNIVVACHDCNQRKRGRTPAEAHMRLINGPPTRPKSLPPRLSKSLIWQPGMPLIWREFGMPTRDEAASYLYWNIELDHND